MTYGMVGGTTLVTDNSSPSSPALWFSCKKFYINWLINCLIILPRVAYISRKSLLLKKLAYCLQSSRCWRLAGWLVTAWWLRDSQLTTDWPWLWVWPRPGQADPGPVPASRSPSLLALTGNLYSAPRYQKYQGGKGGREGGGERRGSFHSPRKSSDFFQKGPKLL